MQVICGASHRLRAIGAFDQLTAWDLTVVKAYIVQRGLFSEEEVNTVEREYKRWLSLIVAHPEKHIAMSLAVDKFWHTHILFTQDYAAMCGAMFGQYLHHRPRILDSEKELDQFFAENTLGLYRTYFGTPNPKYWNSAICQYCAHTLEH